MRVNFRILILREMSIQDCCSKEQIYWLNSKRCLCKLLKVSSILRSRKFTHSMLCNVQDVMRVKILLAILLLRMTICQDNSIANLKNIAEANIFHVFQFAELAIINVYV